MELSVRPIRVCLLQGTVSMGNRPPGGGADGEGVEHPPPLSLRLWLNVFRLTNPTSPLPSLLNAVSQKTA